MAKALTIPPAVSFTSFLNGECVPASIAELRFT